MDSAVLLNSTRCEMVGGWMDGWILYCVWRNKSIWIFMQYCVIAQQVLWVVHHIGLLWSKKMVKQMCHRFAMKHKSWIMIWHDRYGTSFLFNNSLGRKSIEKERIWHPKVLAGLKMNQSLNDLSWFWSCALWMKHYFDTFSWVCSELEHREEEKESSGQSLKS
eukprot:282021_1